MIKKILVAVDGSPPSQRAVEFASVIAQQSGAELSLIHTHHSLNSIDSVQRLAEKGGFLDKIEDDLTEMYDLASTGSPDEEPAALVDVLPEAVVERIGAIILQMASDVAAEHGVETIKSEVAAGDPARAILSAAEREKVDLIAIGSRGLGDLRALILGSVSHKVVQDAGCPCVVVK